MSVMNVVEHEELNRLLAQTSRGDQKAFSQLYDLTSPRLFGLCLRMLSDRQEAEEVMQEAFVTVWQRGTTFDPAKASAMTWLVTLVRNKSIDRLRQRQGALIDRNFEFDAMVDEQPNPAMRAEQDHEYERLRQCLDELEPQQRHSVREAFFSGATYNELAARAKVPLGTMKSWIRRSLLQLRACLNT